MTLWKTLMLLGLIVWVGGIIFFSFVLAPTVFLVLPIPLAGNVVSRSLNGLHWMGMVSAVVFLAASLLYSHGKFARFKPLALVNVLTLLMLALTLISQFAVTPRMHVLRSQIQFADDVRDPARNEFDRLHEWSTRLEGSVLALGIVVTLLTARRLN